MMGRDSESDTVRRSRSPDADRYGRDHSSRRKYQTSRDHGQRDERDSRRERDADRKRRSRDDEGERHHGDRERDRRGERDGRDRPRNRSHDRHDDGGQYSRTRSSDRRTGRATYEGRVELDMQAKSNGLASTEKRSSRWGDAPKAANDASGSNRLGFGVEDRNGGGAMYGAYGPADTGRPSGGGRGGGGGRGQGNGAPRDESWVEHRLKLRAEARVPRGVWNRSPSPPKKKEPRITKAPAAADTLKKTKIRGRGREDAREEARRAESANKARTKKAKRKPRRRRSPSITSAASDSSSSSSSSSNSSSNSSSSSGGDSSNTSDSDSSNGGDSSNGENSGGEGQKKARRTSGKRKGRESSRHEEEQIRPKVARSISPTSPSPLAANTEVKTVADEHLQNAAPDEEMDELDAKEAAQFKADVQGHRHHEESEEDDGPMPVPQLDELQGEGERGVNYGGALLPGEGAAIAQFVQKGLRIPRRGEVGWAGQEIERLEDSGYVMSGSRHARMNAVRLRKENQVFNAEERRALALIMFEEKQQKENEILGNFRQMLTESSREGEKPSADSASAL